MLTGYLNITYSSSNTSVATVDEYGLVTAMDTGSAVIRLSTGDGIIYEKSTFDLNVSVFMAPTSIEAYDYTEYYVGDMDNVYVSYYPNNLNVKYHSDNSSVAEVSEKGIIHATGAGTATVTMTVGDGVNYEISTASTKVKVNKFPIEIYCAEVTEFFVGESDNIYVSYSPSSLNVTYRSSNTSVAKVKQNGKITAVGEGTAVITMTIGDGINYEISSANMTVNVARFPTEINCHYPNMDLALWDMDNLVFTTYPSDLNVTFRSNDSSVVTVDERGIITAVGIGNATVYLSFKGDNTYLPTESEVHVRVDNPYANRIYVSDITKYYKGHDRFAAYVLNHDGYPLPYKDVYFTINGITYERTTDDNGIASIDLDLPSGTYNVTTSFEDSEISSTVRILPTVNAADIVKVCQNNTQYYATFLDTSGNYLPEGTEVQFNINGVLYDRKIITDKGLARLNINLAPGEYIINAVNPVNGEKHSNNITVISRFIECRNITKYFKNATRYTVKVIGDDGKAAGAGESVAFNINGVFYTRQTDEKGIAKMNINLAPGDYIITADFKGCKISNTIKVLPVLSAKDIKMTYKDGTKFEARLIDGTGAPLANATLEFNINGVIYQRTSNEKGTAGLNINLMAGKYIITSSYNGCSIANTIDVS